MDKNKNICATKDAKQLKESVNNLHKYYINCGLSPNELKQVIKPVQNNNSYFITYCSIAVLLISVVIYWNLFTIISNYFFGVRCIVRNNYFIWEATRPISDCNFCRGLSDPVVLQNVSKTEFAPYAYTSKPVLIKQAFLHWPAIKLFNLNFFKNLYSSVNDSYKTVDDECQFLHFKSNFISIKDVLNMPALRIKNAPGETSWYVGWGNCHPVILNEMRRHYPKPHFLPDDCEIPPKEYVFMGYDDGATMHLDFINRLMWQAQLQGTKTWHLLPPPECEEICQSIEFVAEPGDAVLVDTRVWYHGTTIKNGEFSLSIQSEYG